jgi:hypothetical protein
MIFAILEPIPPSGAQRIVMLCDEQKAVPTGLSIVDVSNVTPAPQLHWVTTDDGETFSDPAVPGLAVGQAVQIGKLRAGCTATITGGFQSSALGAAHTYASDDASQRNLQAARASGAIPLLLMCADLNAVWALFPHIASQVEQVNTDWIAFRQSQQLKLVSLEAQVNAATSISAAQAIVWTPA